jgi:hypothetical protein
MISPIVGMGNRIIMILFLFVLALTPPIYHRGVKRVSHEIGEILWGRTPIAPVLAPGAGLDRALPADAFDMRQALIENGVKTYRLSAPLMKRIFFQRIVEGSYPILPTLNAKHAFISNEEPIKKCKLIQQLKEVRLVYCP